MSCSCVRCAFSVELPSISFSELPPLPHPYHLMTCICKVLPAHDGMIRQLAYWEAKHGAQGFYHSPSRLVLQIHLSCLISRRASAQCGKESTAPVAMASSINLARRHRTVAEHGGELAAGLVNAVRRLPLNKFQKQELSIVAYSLAVSHQITGDLPSAMAVCLSIRYHSIMPVHIHTQRQCPTFCKASCQSLARN